MIRCGLALGGKKNEQSLSEQATQAQALAANPTPLIGAALIYIAMLWPLVALVTRLEKRFKAGRR